MAQWIVFCVGTAMALIGAMGVVLVRNPVHAALLLVQTLFGVAVLFIAQDAEYQRLQREIPIPPPTDPRAVGAQDLTWALINTPAFLFNR